MTAFDTVTISLDENRVKATKKPGVKPGSRVGPRLPRGPKLERRARLEPAALPPRPAPGPICEAVTAPLRRPYRPPTHRRAESRPAPPERLLP
jgi:hypothetical protein